MAVVDLGGGRQRKEDAIDPGVGLLWHAPVGTHLAPGDPVAEVLARPGQDVGAVVRRIAAALAWSDAPVEPPPLVLGRLPARRLGGPGGEES
jgi:thymidine phosphorylase